jgi:hypothetical protein
MTEPEGEIAQPQGASPADELRLTFEQVAEHALGIADGRDFAAQFDVTIPAAMSRNLVQPIIGEVDRTKLPLRISAQIIIARMKGEEAGKPNLLAAMGNMTLDGTPTAVRMPEAAYNDYFGASFEARGPYEAFVVTAENDEVYLQAKQQQGGWKRLSTDSHGKGPEDYTPGYVFATILATQALARRRENIRLQKSTRHLTGRWLLPPDTLH